MEGRGGGEERRKEGREGGITRSYDGQRKQSTFPKRNCLVPKVFPSTTLAYLSSVIPPSSITWMVGVRTRWAAMSKTCSMLTHIVASIWDSPQSPSEHTSSTKAFQVPTQQMWLFLSLATLSMLVLLRELILFLYYNYFQTWFSTPISPEYKFP